MKLLLAVALCAMTGPAAFAADEWKGAYAGLQAGNAYTTTDYGDLEDYWDNQEVNGISDRGSIVGAYAGYARQDGTLVYGVEGAWSSMNNKDKTDLGNAGGTFGVGANMQTKFFGLSTIKARFGIAADNSLFYMAVGPAWARTKFINDSSNYSGGKLFTKSATIGGVALAGGIESRFWKGLIGRFQAEYVRLDPRKYLDSKNLVSGGRNASFRGTSSMLNLTFGVAYKFY
jgi:hypothetical protein